MAARWPPHWGSRAASRSADGDERGRPLFLEGLEALHKAGRLVFLGDLAPLGEKEPPSTPRSPRLRRAEWVVYAKRPFAGPKAVLAYLARYTHRVAISNSRLMALDDKGVTFKWKDYRVEGRDRFKAMTLDGPTSSSAAFSCTCCRAASTASDTLACSPARFAPGTFERARLLLRRGGGCTRGLARRDRRPGRSRFSRCAAARDAAAG